MNIQWYPGHMTKTRSEIESDIKLVDAVAEITDARCPEASRNPLLAELTAGKPRVLLLNKCDYAPGAAVKQWKAFYEKQGYHVLACDCKTGRGVDGFTPLLLNALSGLVQRRKDKNDARALSVMVAGIPNVGKSSLINRLAGARKTVVADRPGVTRGRQWITVTAGRNNKAGGSGTGIVMLDTPGILWHKFDDEQAALRLAFVGSIKDDVMDTESLALELAKYLLTNYPELVADRYGISEYDDDFLARLAKSRGFLISGGEPDTARAAAIFLDEFRSGKLGAVCLELPSYD